MRNTRNALPAVGEPIDRQLGWAAVYVFSTGNDVLQVAEAAYTNFTSESMPTMPDLQQMEKFIVTMTLELLRGGGDAVGHLTSGGAESIFLALQAARAWARAQRVDMTQPGIVVPDSAHPAFDQAAQELDLRITRVPLRADLRADTVAMAAAITPQTILLVGSAPCFPYGVIDPVAELSDLAQAHHLWLHVDASVGGFVAPFVRDIGYAIPAFDFTLPGVSSISADLHQYGFAAKGTSTLLYRDEALRRRQPLTDDTAANGALVPPLFREAQSGGAVAAAWAIMHYLSVEGYRAMAQTIMQARDMTC